jgi:hypothetical protein
MIDDAAAERLAHVAAQLAAMVRDESPDAVARWLCAECDGVDRWNLLFLLAAMVPTDQTPGQLLAWYWDLQRRQHASRILRAIEGGAA